MKILHPDFVKISTASELFDCDRATMEAIIRRAQESHDVRIMEWNGQRRVHYPDLLKYALNQLAGKL